jgi:DNA recombination protein RmuC
MDIAAVLVALITLAAGIAAGWALARARIAAESSAQVGATATALAERDAAVAERDRIRSERDDVAVRLRTAELQVQGAATKLASLESNEQRLKDTFARMSSEALQRSSTQFLELADARFKQAGGPLTDTLGKVELQLKEIEKERAGAQRVLTEQIDSVRKTGDALRQETAALVSALRKPQARGRWGELQLRRCIELAGMTDRCDFFEQASVATSEGLLRPDVVIRLVGGKSIIVDSKVTLAAYLEAYEATDDATRAERLAAHAKHLKHHVNDLASKAYWAQFSPSPEFVVLFVPGDPFLAAALDNDPGLIDDAFSKRVHIATPSTLISVLRAVAYAWQQEALAENAQQVFELGCELYKRLGTMGGHMDDLGKRLTSAVKAYNGTVGSFEKNVLASARKLNALEIVDYDLDSPAPVDEPVRTLGAAELVESAAQSRAVVALPAIVVPETAGESPALELDGRPEDYGIDAADPATAPSESLDRRTGS